MAEVLNSIVSIPAPFNMVVMITLIAATAGLIAGIAGEIRKYGCHRQDIDFKRELVERGLSVEEIERIVSVPVAERVEKATAVSDNYLAGAAPAKA